MNKEKVLCWLSNNSYSSWHANRLVKEAIEGPSNWTFFSSYREKVYQFIYDLNLVSDKHKPSFKKSINETMFKDQLFTRSLEDFLKEVEDYRLKKYKRTKKLKKIREKIRIDQGNNFKKNMKIGDIYIVSYNYIDRAIIVLDIDEDEFIGRYLDRADKRVHKDTKETPGYVYIWWGDQKLKWDNKSYKKSNAVTFKNYKFIKSKLNKENIMIL